MEGARSLIEDLIQQVKVGPRSAHVTDINVAWTAYQQRFSGFEIR